MSEQTTIRTIEVTVRFPLAQGDPYHQREQKTTTVGDTLTGALEHFDIHQDPQSQYYLSHRGTQLADGLTIGEVADKQDAVDLTLVKVLIQG